MSAMSRFLDSDQGTCAVCGRVLSGAILAHSELHVSYEAGYWLKRPGCQARSDRERALDRLARVVEAARAAGVVVTCLADGQSL